MTRKVMDLQDILVEPTIEIAKVKIVEFDEKEYLNEKTIEKLFNPDILNNHCKENILARVIVLDRLYSTRLNDNETEKTNTMPSIIAVTERIYEFELEGKFDSCIDAEGVKELVEEFLKGFKDKSTPYSFITKYCSFRFPNISVPIQDSYVKGMLYYYNECEQYHYTDRFTQDEIKNYSFFCKVFDCFVKKFNLGELSTKNIDKYLWLYAKEETKKGNNIQIY